MIWHIEKSVVGGEIVEGEKGAEGGLFSVGDGTGFFIDES